MQYCTTTELRHFTADECLEIALTHRTVPKTCEHLYLNGQGIILHPDLLEKMKAPELDTDAEVDDQNTISMDSEASWEVVEKVVSNRQFSMSLNWCFITFKNQNNMGAR